MQGNGLFEAGNLPQLPSNAQYVYHENKCYDWGTFGWALSSGKVDPSKYKHIIFMNSSIRGPFLPPYWPVRSALATHSLDCFSQPGAVCVRAACSENLAKLRYVRMTCKQDARPFSRQDKVSTATSEKQSRPWADICISVQETVHWSQILTSRLTAEVKLVGATISCEPCWQGGNTANAKRHNAHVQSYFMATDQVCRQLHSDCMRTAGHVRGLRLASILLHAAQHGSNPACSS